MPVTSVGLYEIVLEQLYFGDINLNVFHYLSNTSDDDAQELASLAFDEDVMAALAVIQSDNLVYTNIRCKNITGNLADFNRIPSQVDGDVAGADAAGFVGAGFRYNRTTKETRNGGKRFSAMVEENITGGTFTVAYNIDLDALAVVLSAEISTVGQVLSPVILRKPDDGAGNWTYNVLQSAVNLNRVTTQNSRKTF